MVVKSLWQSERGREGGGKTEICWFVSLTLSIFLGVTIFRRRRQAAWGRDGERVGWR